jgi:hypothetical protein
LTVQLKKANLHDREANTNVVFWLGIVLCTVYLSYRYPLQINSSGTSPTYSDTPIVLQLGKFLLALPLIAISAFRWLSNSARLPRGPIVVVTLFLSSFALLKTLEASDSQYLDVSFWMFFSLVLVLGVDSITISAVDRYFYFLLWFAFGSTMVQVFLFVAFGRLPALAYDKGYLVRFGGFLDDPNGFAAILFLLMGYSYKRFSGRTCFLIVTGLVICLGLTQSWTAIAFFSAILFFYTLVSAFKRPLSAVLAICVLPFAGMFLFRLAALLQQGLFLGMLQGKQESIEGHIFPWALWASKWSEWVLLGDWRYNAYESFWQAAMVNFGLLWCGAYLVLIVGMLIYAHRAFWHATPESKPVYSGLLLFGYYFALGSFNLPFPIIFPINALFFLFFFLVVMGKIASQAQTTVAARSAGALAKATGE